MESNLFSLFDDLPEEEPKDNSAKKTSAKKKAAAKQKEDSPLSLFEEATSNNDTPEAPEGTLPLESTTEQEQNIQATIVPVEDNTAPTPDTPITDNNTEHLDTHYKGEMVSNDYLMFMSLEEKQAAEALADEEANNDTNEHSGLEEWDLTKKYYSIGEVAKLFEVNTSHIRFWSKEFKLKLRTTRKGDRMYTPQDIEKLRYIYELVKVKKHTIKGARELLQTNKKKVVESKDLKDNLKDLKSLLVGIQKKL